MTTPGATPLAISMLATGIMVSVRMYIGMPMTAAKGIAQKESAPINDVVHFYLTDFSHKVQ